jgi:photosynthetic reaction center cytochrome c subunit
MGSWSEAVPFGIFPHLDWTAAFSIRYGNLFYNPFHMLSIAFLYGSTCCSRCTVRPSWPSAASAVTARSTRSRTAARPRSGRPVLALDDGLQRHDGIDPPLGLVVRRAHDVTGGIGILLTGTVVDNWYLWVKHGVKHGDRDRSTAKAGDIYKNVQVLNDISAAEFNRLMVAITNWVSPEEGCNYCHGNDGFEKDDKYTKMVARTMIAMTQRTNEAWGEQHTAPTGVTCWTCHRGQPVPQYVFAQDPGRPLPGALAKVPNGQNIAGPLVGYASLPSEPLNKYLSGDAEIGIAGPTALPTGNDLSIKDAEWTYSLMMYFSGSLGVNCTYCHNSQSFAKWEGSPPARLTAWHGINMVREVNSTYIAATEEYLPEHRKGPLGDVPKVACETCHQGAYKPLYGAQMLKDYPNLARESDGAKALLAGSGDDINEYHTDAGSTGGGH